MTVVAVNSLISLGIIQMLLGRMAGLAEMKKAWSMEQGAWSIKTELKTHGAWSTNTEIKARSVAL